MEIRDFLDSLPQEMIEKGNLEQIANADKEHKEFLSAFNNGFCYLCGMKLSYLNISEKCFHWFLLPDGIKKKYFDEYLTEPIGFFQIESYLRWVANTETYIKNINDLKNENPNGKLIETTIKYKHIDWSLNFGRTDLNGHETSKYATFPHFHLQILNNNLPFIGFDDYHIPFSKHDLFIIEAIKNEDIVEHHYLFGEGIGLIENEVDLKWIDQRMIPCESEEEATFHTRSFIQIPENIVITIDEIEEMRKESKDKGISFRKYIKEKIPNIKIISETFPGQGVVNKKKRKKR